MRVLRRFKDWRLNRNRFGKISFIGFHHAGTDLNIMLDSFVKFFHSDFSSFNCIFPKELKFNDLKTGFDLEEFIAELKKKKPIRGFDLDNDFSENNIYSAAIWRDTQPDHVRACVGIGFKNNKLSLPVIDLLNPDTLFLASLSEIDYVDWQDARNIDNYKFRGGLKYTKTNHGEKIVDIGERPGRTTFTKYFNYCGASKIWFGPMIYQFISQKLILSFEGAIEVKILKNDITYVHLYEGIYDGDNPGNQEVQRRFREHIGIDSLKIE